ncbi:MAG: hypothetical protein AABW86_03580 [Candidatus Micrarchaeota archaeon]
MTLSSISKNPKFLTMLVLFILFAAGLIIYSKFAGLLLIFSLIIFGALSIWWKEKEVKLAGLAALVILSLLNIGLNGMKFGIDFSGGTRIPVILEQAVPAETMNELVQTIKTRASVLGLTEVRVRAIGDTEIDVEIPSSDETQIKFIEDVLSHQGVYFGVVDGKIAITGEDIYSTSIRPSQLQELQQSGADWGVDFSITKNGAETFAQTVKGKPNYPLFMFLDRPNDAVLFISEAELQAGAPPSADISELVAGAKSALSLEDEKTIELYLTNEFEENESSWESMNITPKSNKTKAIVSGSMSETTKQKIKSLGFVLKEVSPDDFTPNFAKSPALGYIPSEWKAVGMLSAPALSPKITEGLPSYSYSISGAVSGTGKDATAEASESTKRIVSILKGGSLPVQISLGSRTSLPANLGSEFLKLSLIGIISALIAISVLVGIRYRHLKTIFPIVAISISELIILLSILGSFTVDLAAMAGIIAAIGVGVDAQIVITDEILKRDNYKMLEKMEHAFDIIKTNVIVAIISMVPLLFSGLVEVIGFAISTMLGSLLGFLLSRPAYAVIAEKVLEEKGGPSTESVEKQ